jgi:hypothetical protein
MLDLYVQYSPKIVSRWDIHPATIDKYAVHSALPNLFLCLDIIRLYIVPPGGAGSWVREERFRANNRAGGNWATR